MAAEKERNAEAGRTPPHVLVTGAAGFKGRRLTGSQGRRSGLPLLHALFYELTGRSRRNEAARSGAPAAKQQKHHALAEMCTAAEAPADGAGVDVAITDGGRTHQFLPWRAAFAASTRDVDVFSSCGEPSSCSVDGSWASGCCPANATSLTWVVHRHKSRNQLSKSARSMHSGGQRAPTCFQVALRTLPWAPRLVCRSKTATLLELLGSATLPPDAQAQLQASLAVRGCTPGAEDVVMAAVVSDWFTLRAQDVARALDVARVPNPTNPSRQLPVWQAQKRESILRLWEADATAGTNVVPVEAGAAARASRRNASGAVPCIAVVSYGLVRSTEQAWFDHTFGALRRYVLEPLAPHAALFADYSCVPPACSAKAVRRAMGARADLKSLCITAVVPWEQIYVLDATMCSWSRKESKAKEISKTRDLRHNYLMGLWSLHRAMLAVQAARDRRGIGATIITRIDTLFFAPSFLDVLEQRPWDDAGRVYVPETGSYGFLSDQFAYGHVDVMHRFVTERLKLVMSTCEATMPAEVIACRVAALHNWSTGISTTRFVRLRADWEVRTCCPCLPITR